FSRSSSSVTTTISPLAKAAMASVTVQWGTGILEMLEPGPGSGLLPDLPAMAQIVIGQHAGHHGLRHGHGADADAGIVAALGDEVQLGAVARHRATRGKDRGGRLHREAHHDGLAVGDSTQDAARM